MEPIHKHLNIKSLESKCQIAKQLPNPATSEVLVVNPVDREPNAQQVYDEFGRIVRDIGYNQRKLELGTKYHSSPVFQKGYDLYARCFSLVGGNIQMPSLSQTLDLQERTLGRYVRCLDAISHFVHAQAASIAGEVDSVEGELLKGKAALEESNETQLRASMQNASTQRERRKYANALYTVARTERNQQLSSEFFGQYVTQEEMIGTIGHSLDLLRDQTALFQTYVGKSKAFFVTVRGIGAVTTHINSCVDEMRQHTQLLQEQSAAVSGYLQNSTSGSFFPSPNSANHSSVYLD